MKLFRSLVLTLLAFALAAPLHARIDPDLLAGMKARSIGPAGMSGRIGAIDAVASNPNVVWVGAATGGVWKSVDGGLTWTPVFDDQPVAAIGALAINQTSPEIVWVGTGEAQVRNSVSVGNGIYKTIDGGKTWTHLGLEKTERISEIILHPTNPDVAWVAAMGQEYGENPERGVYKTTDGGKTWTKVLYVDPRTGAADLVIDPTNPDKLFAAMWDYRRWPWFFRSGGPGSGLYVTRDGGANWTKLTVDDGMPKGVLGRIGVAIAPSDPNVVYALVEADKSAMLRSEDGGKSFKTVNEETDVSNRPFYYADIAVDPDFPNRVYNLASSITVTDDGGSTFRSLVPFRKAHPDHHAIWIDPNDGRRIVEGNDGGVNFSTDRGETWRFVSNLPLAQYYHIATDNAVPYNVYGGMQDNGSWRGPNTVWENGGIRNMYWDEVGFGDGFGTLPMPDDPQRGYSMSQEGYIVRWDNRTGERKDIRPAGPEGVKLRFNWNAAIAQDPFDASTIYFGSQFVHKSTDRGDTWTTISPDLTTNNPDWQHQDKSGGLTIDATGAENYTTIIAIAPSAVDRNVIWAGTDDGRVHVTRDGGANWTSVEDNFKGVPKNTWVPHVEASRFDAGEAFVVFDNHRRSDWTPYVYRTTDYGKTWKSITTSDLKGYALTVVQDPVDRDLLFLGTEFGLWATLDGGKQWMKWTYGFPTVSAMALTIQARENDLVIGTHGRAAYVIDDIAPLRAISEKTLAEPLHLFPIHDAQQHEVKQTGASRFPGDSEFRGESEPYGALVTFSLSGDDLPLPDPKKERERKEKERKAKMKPLPITAGGVPEAVKPEEAKKPESEGAEKGAAMDDEGGRGDREKGPKAEIRVTDAAGKLVRKFEHPVTLGVNRVAWDLHRDAFEAPPRERSSFRGEPRGPEVLPGVYTIAVKFRDVEASETVNVLSDPRTSIPLSAMQAKDAAIVEVGHLQETAAKAIKRIARVRDDVRTIAAKVKAADADAKKNADSDDWKPSPIVKAAAKLQKRLGDIEKMFWTPPKTKGIVAEEHAMAKIGYVMRSLQSSWDAPTPAQMDYVKEASSVLQKAVDALNEFEAKDLAAFRDEAGKAGVTLLPAVEPLTIKP